MFNLILSRFIFYDAKVRQSMDISVFVDMSAVWYISTCWNLLFWYISTGWNLSFWHISTRWNLSFHKIYISRMKDFNPLKYARMRDFNGLKYTKLLTYLHTAAPLTDIDNFECADLWLVKKGPTACGEYQTPVDKLFQRQKIDYMTL